MYLLFVVPHLIHLDQMSRVSLEIHILYLIYYYIILYLVFFNIHIVLPNIKTMFPVKKSPSGQEKCTLILFINNFDSTY